LGEAGVTCPKVGDIVYWTGDGGPQYVLLLTKDEVWKDHYRVLWLGGKPLEDGDDDEWRLNAENQVSWEVVA